MRIFLFCVSAPAALSQGWGELKIPSFTESSNSLVDLSIDDDSVILLIHGWNPSAAEKTYERDLWKNLINEIGLTIAGTPWRLQVLD